MALSAGERFDDWSSVPEPSRPTTHVESLIDLPGGQGTRHVARRGTDGTRWCLTCMQTLPADGRQAFCPTCARERHRIRQGERRRTQVEGSVTVPVAAVEQLMRHVSRLDGLIGRVLSAHETGADASALQRRLNLTTKQLTVLAHSEFGERLVMARTQSRRIERPRDGR